MIAIKTSGGKTDYEGLKGDVKVSLKWKIKVINYIKRWQGISKFINPSQQAHAQEFFILYPFIRNYGHVSKSLLL